MNFIELNDLPVYDLYTEFRDNDGKAWYMDQAADSKIPKKKL
jgi:hypothetical protein